VFATHAQEAKHTSEGEGKKEKSKYYQDCLRIVVSLLFGIIAIIKPR
jgi:hypothetical protein